LKSFDAVIRSMAVRAIRRGIKASGKNSHFNLLSAFRYADGQLMTTMTGIITENDDQFKSIIEDTQINKWPFYNNSKEDFVESVNIFVPTMTVAERYAVDKKFFVSEPGQIHKELEFKYGDSDEEHRELIEGYQKFYKYLPYYGKVIY